jgi:hypothetical protein
MSNSAGIPGHFGARAQREEAAAAPLPAALEEEHQNNAENATEDLAHANQSSNAEEAALQQRESSSGEAVHVGVNGSASDVDESGDSDGADDSEGDAAEDNMDAQSKPWLEHVMTIFEDIKHEINTALDMRGQGRSATFHGEMPRKYCHLIMPSPPSEDPEAYFPGQLLKREHFSYPHIRVWLPEGVHKSGLVVQ